MSPPVAPVPLKPAAARPSCLGKGWWLLLCLWWPLRLGAEPPDVLIINSYAPGYEWSDEMLRGLRAELAKAFPEFEPVIQYLDYRRFPDPQREQWLLEDIGYKCRVRPPG